jgi:hypothetical protein
MVFAQPSVRHLTGVPPMPSPVISNHITNLSASIAGRPIPQRPGARPIPVIGGWIGGGWYPLEQPQAQPTPLVFVNQQNVAPAPAPILVMNPDYKPEVAQPVLREYSNIRNPYENFEPNAPKIFLLALKDGTLRQSVAFWSEGDKLHFVQPDKKQDSVLLKNLDRESSQRFNSERGLEIKLPE